MPGFDLIIVGDVVTADRILRNGFVGVRGERIEVVGAGTPPAAKTLLDASGCWIMPGVVDGQVHTGSQAGQEGLASGNAV
jgi:allantoinase